MASVTFCHFFGDDEKINDDAVLGEITGRLKFSHNHIEAQNKITFT